MIHRGISIESYCLKANGYAPNSPLPVLVYRQAFKDALIDFESRLRANGWPPDWRNALGMYPKHHFHSDAHELIVIARGSLTGRFGGHDGRDVALSMGDVVVIPAGVAHLGVSVSDDLFVSGAFPAGMAIHDFRLCYPSEYRRMLERVRTIQIPISDPIFGDDGPLIAMWRSAAAHVAH